MGPFVFAAHTLSGTASIAANYWALNWGIPHCAGRRDFKHWASPLPWLAELSIRVIAVNDNYQKST